jgi:hydroxymethylpyrimidine/phosphomethylpyrimidine kinase
LSLLRDLGVNTANGILYSSPGKVLLNDNSELPSRRIAIGGFCLIPQVLTIAGSDSGGGAGIQADIKAIQASGGYGLSVITSITAQNTQTVTAALDLPLEIIEQQFNAVFDDFEIAALKTGMLSSIAIVDLVANLLTQRKPARVIVDPVMVSKGGYPLLRPDAVTALREKLLPLALVVTPNRHEAQILSGIDVREEEDAREAGLRILETGCRAVLIKGGHVDSVLSTDYLVTDRGMRAFSATRVASRNTHGTGCTFSAALATWIARGMELEEAVDRAKLYVTEAIRHGLAIGHGQGPTDHFWFLRNEDASR